MAGLQPLPGFDWLQVSWGGPNQRRTQQCSYCDAPMDPGGDECPLILWNDRGWCAEFCEACQVRWWGFTMLTRTDRDDDDEEPG